MYLIMWYSGANCSLKSQINTAVHTVHKFGLRTYTEKSYLTVENLMFLGRAK